MAAAAVAAAFAFNRPTVVHLVPVRGGAHSHSPDEDRSGVAAPRYQPVLQESGGVHRMVHQENRELAFRRFPFGFDGFLMVVWSVFICRNNCKKPSTARICPEFRLS